MIKCYGLVRLTRDPELRYTPSGSALASVGVSANKHYKGEDKAHYYELKCFGKTAEILSNHLKKGHQVLISGEVQFEQWQDKQGQKRQKHVIVGNQLEFVESKPKNQPPQNNYQNAQAPQNNYQPPPQQQYTQKPPANQGFNRQEETGPDFDDDCPF